MGPFSSLTYSISQLMGKYFLRPEVSVIEEISRLSSVEGTRNYKAGTPSSAEAAQFSGGKQERDTHGRLNDLYSLKDKAQGSGAGVPRQQVPSAANAWSGPGRPAQGVSASLVSACFSFFPSTSLCEKRHLCLFPNPRKDE